jgi:hypothetical protein
MVEEQLCQERSARQQAESKLQQRQVALEEAKAALLRECSAREEALLTVYFGAPSMFITLWFGFDY